MRTSLTILLAMFLLTTPALVSCSLMTVEIKKPQILQDAVDQSDLQAAVLLYGHLDTIKPVGGHLAYPIPQSGCAPYRDVSKDRKTIYFVSNDGACSVSERIHRAQMAGAEALILGHTDDSVQELSITEKFPQVNIPVIVIKHSLGTKFKQTLLSKDKDLKDIKL